MIKIIAYIVEKILGNVKKDNYFIWKKANLLCEANLLFLVLLLLVVTPVHGLDFQKHPILFIGDIIVAVGLIISILFLRNGNVFGAGVGTVLAFMMIPLIHNLIGDWLLPNQIGSVRYFETLIMVCFLFVLIITYSISQWQIYIGSFFAVPIILGHFFVLKIMNGVEIPYTYLLYALLPFIMTIVASINLNLANDAVRSLVESKEQMEEWNRTLEKTVKERTTELIEINQKLEVLSNTDGLTKIGNRRYFDNALTLEWSRAQRSCSNIALIIGDVDRFKNYNDLYGHLAGDECLGMIAKIFKDKAKRESDLIARYGGEEFVVLIPVITKEQAVQLAEMLTEGFQEMKLPHSGSKFGFVTISLGIAVMCPKPNQKSVELLKAADEAMYLAKKNGGNQYILWDEENS